MMECHLSQSHREGTALHWDISNQFDIGQRSEHGSPVYKVSLTVLVVIVLRVFNGGNFRWE